MAKNQTNEVNVSREIKELMDSGIALNRLPKLIEQMYRANLNLFVWGDPGIGKTQSVEQFVTIENITSYRITFSDTVNSSIDKEKTSIVVDVKAEDEVACVN